MNSVNMINPHADRLQFRIIVFNKMNTTHLVILFHFFLALTGLRMA